MIQMEAERRRRKTGVKQWIEKGSGHVCMSICTYLCIYVCMFLENISQLKAYCEVKAVPKESCVLNTLLRRVSLCYGA